MSGEMSHQVEAMDIDCIDSEFDNKENTFNHNNVPPCTEKGYEEMDVSELNMKLWYPVTPTGSPMSKSFTYCTDNRSHNSTDILSYTHNEANLTRSLNSTMTKNDNTINSLKTLTLQSIPPQKTIDKNTPILRQLESSATTECNNVTINVIEPGDVEENISLPSTTSSALHTPEPTTPTKDIPRVDNGSPIMRGLKSVLNMFRSSQSPIPPVEENSTIVQQETSSNINTDIEKTEENLNSKIQNLPSTAIPMQTLKDNNGSKRSSPYKDSIVFNDDLEKELQWNDESTISFSQEKIPVHKLFFQHTNSTKTEATEVNITEKKTEGNLNTTTEFMDISCNDSLIGNKTMIVKEEELDKNESSAFNDSDCEFLDCETTFTKNETQTLGSYGKEFNIVSNIDNLTSTSDEKILNETIQDIVHNKVESIMTSTPAELNLNMVYENLNNELVDPLDDNFHNEPFNSQTKIVDQVLTSQEKLFENMHRIGDKLINVNSTSQFDDPANVTNLALKDSKCLEYEPDSLEVNFIRKGNETDVTHNIHEKTITEFSMPENNLSCEEDSKLLIQNNDLILPAKIPIPDVDVNEMEQISVTEQNVTLNDTSVNGTSKNEAISVTPETPNNTLNIFGQINEIPLNVTNILNIKEEISTNHEEGLENVYPSVDEHKCGDALNIIHNKKQITDEIQKCLPTFDSPENEFEYNYITDQNNSVNVFNKPQPKKDKQDNSLFSNEFLNTNEDPETTRIDEHRTLTTNQNIDNVVKVSNTKVSEESEIRNLHQIVVNYISDESVFEHKTKDQIETSGALKDDKSKEIVQNPMKTTVSEANQSIKNDIGDDTHPLNSFKNDMKEESLLHLQEKPLVENTDESKVVLVVNEEILQNKENYEKQAKDCADENQSAETLKEQQVDNTIENKTEILNSSISNLKAIATNEITNSDVNLNIAQAETPLPSNGNIIMSKEISSNHTNIGVDTDIFTNEKGIDITMQQTNESVNSETIEVKTMFVLESLNLDKDSSDKNVKIGESDTFILDEEIVVLSENNSPYVSVATDLDKVDQSSDAYTQNESETVVTTLSNSPPIASKGYNFNFDEIDDPFATKTNIRMSPTLNSPIDSIKSNPNNKSEKPRKLSVGDNRKSLNDKKKLINLKNKQKNIATSIAVETEALVGPKKHVSNYSSETNAFNIKPVKSETDSENDKTLVTDIDRKLESAAVTNITSVDDSNISSNGMLIMDEKCSNMLNSYEINDISNKAASVVLSSNHKNTVSGQSSYYSAGTSSDECIKSRNVFNLPEIDDMNFNPFAVKSKVCQSPPPSKDEDNPFISKSKVLFTPETSMILPKDVETQITNCTIVNENEIKIKDCKDKMDIEPMEKDTSGYQSTETCSSDASQNDTIVREIKTDDEDTLEGPFLEMEDLNNGKMTLLDVENIEKTQFNDMPAPECEDNAEGELFIDAEAFEFLLNQNKSNVVAESGKESLFLKFDPLFAKRISTDSVFTALSEVRKRHSTPIKHKNLQNMSPVAGPSSLNINHDRDLNNTYNEDPTVTMSKPMMVVSPAVNPVATPRKSLTPTRTNRRSMTFTSPAMAVIDRLISLSSNNSLVEHESTFTQASHEQNEAELVLIQLRELLAEKEIHVYNLRVESKELKNRLTVLESHMNTLETESQQRLTKINGLTKTLSEKTRMNKDMAAVVEEYERTIASLIAEKEQDKKQHADERAALINERDEQTAHLASMEVSFNDLHSKYEKSKQVILNYKANEESYKKSLTEFEENFAKVQNNYELLKQHASSKLNHANEELQRINRAHEAEVLKLNAMIKRKDLFITSLEETLAQKTKANEELTAICDELINKVG